MKYVTQLDIQEMNRLFLEHKTYAAVARITGFSPATVKKYIIKDYQPVDTNSVIRFERPLPEWNVEPFLVQDWGPLCVLSKDEYNEITQLWKEIEV